MVTRITLIFLGALLLTSAMLVGLNPTGAWLSDSAEGASSILYSGSLDLQVSGGPLQISDLPRGGDFRSMGAFCARNGGTTALKFRGLFESDSVEARELLSYMEMQVEKGSAEGWVLLTQVFGQAGGENLPLASYFKFSDQAPGVQNEYILSDVLVPDEEGCYRFSVRLSDQAPDSVQHQPLSFVLSLYATQATNPGWD